MTKDQELLILDAAIDKLGKDSYCGNWLRGVFDEVARDIRSDWLPMASMLDHERSARAIKKAADEYYESRTKSARETAERIVADARSDAAAIKTAALRKTRADIAQSIRDLQRVVEALA